MSALFGSIKRAYLPADLGCEEAASSSCLAAGRGLGVASAFDLWATLIRFGAQTVIPTVQSMSIFDELDPLFEGYESSYLRL